MNEPLIILCEHEDGHPVRRFVDGDAPRGGGAARHEGRPDRLLTQTLGQPAILRAAELGHVFAALIKAGLRLALRR